MRQFRNTFASALLLSTGLLLSSVVEAQEPHFEVIQHLQRDDYPYVNDHAVNDHGDLILRRVSEDITHIFRAEENDEIILEDFRGNSINNFGQVSSLTAIFTPEVGIQTLEEYSNGKAYGVIGAINDVGDIAGRRYFSADCGIFYYSREKNENFCFPVVAGDSYSISGFNNLGDIVGRRRWAGVSDRETLYIILNNGTSFTKTELTLASPGMDDQRFKTITDERRLAGWAQLTDSDPMYTFFADANDLSTFYQYSFLGNLDGGLTDVGYYYTGDKVFNLESLVASDITLDLPGCEVQDGGFSVTDNGTYMVSTLCEVSPGDYKYFATVIRPTSAVASELPGDPIEPILLSEYTLDLSGGDDVSNPEPEENETPSIDTPETPAPSSPEGEDEPEIADPISSLDLLLQAKDSLKDAIQAFKKARGKQAKREARMELRQALKDFRAALKAAKEDGFTPTRKDKRPKRTAKKLLKRPRRA